MTKKELETKVKTLEKMEAELMKFLSVSNGNLFKAAETLITIKSLELFKAPRSEGKMKYRTFNAYLDYLNLPDQVRKIIEKLMKLTTTVYSDKKMATLTQFFPSEIKFWMHFFKIREEFWIDAIDRLEILRDEDEPKFTDNDLEIVFEETPEIKIGYTGNRSSSVISGALGMINHLSEEDIKNFSGDVDGITIGSLCSFTQEIMEKKTNGTIIFCTNRNMLTPNTLFSVKCYDDGTHDAVRATTYTHIGKMFLLFSTIAFLTGGIVGGVLIKFWPQIMAMFK